MNCDLEEKSDVIAGMNMRIKGLVVSQPNVPEN
jgi:hypothetical protein